jgi:MtN3 and saliva related transmembrane protein
MEGDVHWAVRAIGLLAGLCTTIAFLPQVIKTLRSRSTRDISLGMFLVFTVGVVLWLAYGLFVGDLPLILANGVTFVLAAAILVLKIRHG